MEIIQKQVNLTEEYQAFAINYCIVNNINYEIFSYYDWDFGKEIEVVLVDDNFYNNIFEMLVEKYPSRSIYFVDSIKMKVNYA